MTPFARRLTLLVTSGAGLGYAPVAPGTFGTLPGIALAAALVGLPWWGQAGVLAILIIALVPLCGVAERIHGTKDPKPVVADEYVTLPLCLLGLPWTANLWLLPVAFVVHRVLDILKPPPARGLQDIGGGLGIMIDDVISSLYGLGVMHLIWRGAQAL